MPVVAGQAPSAHLETLVRSGGLSVLGAGFSALAGIGLVAVITQGLPRDRAGTIFATTALFLIASAVVQLGAEVGLVRYLPVQIATGRLEDLRPTLRSALRPVALLSGVVGVATALAAPRLAPLVAGEAAAGAVTEQLRVLAVFLPVAAVYNVLLAATRGCRTMRPTVAVEALGRNALQVLAVAGAVVADVGPTGVVVAWAAPYVVGLVAAGWVLARLLGRVGRPGTAAPGEGHGERGPAAADGPSSSAAPSSFWGFTAPRAVASTAQTLLKRSDIVLVAALRGPGEAALYTAATRFVVFGQLGVQALQQALAPQLSALFARGERRAAQEVYETATAWSVLLAWPVYLGCAALAPLLLGVFGAGYEGAAAVVVVLSLAMLVATGSGSVDTVLLMSGRSWLSLANTGAALAVNLGLNLLLIPRLGIVGAALAWAAAIVVRNALPLLEIRSLLGMTPLGAGTVWVGASALVCLGLPAGALRLAGAPSAAVLAGLALGLVAYAGLLVVGRERVRLDSLVRTVRRPRSGPTDLPAGAR